MKNISDFIHVTIPFLVAIGIQLVATMGIMFVFGLASGIKRISSGEEMPDAMLMNMTSETTLVVSSLIAIICLIVFAIWYKKISLKVTKENVLKKVNIKTVMGIILLGVGIQIGFSFLLNIIAFIKPDWFKSYGQVMGQLGMGNSFISLIYVGFIAPFSEEFIFRGVTLKRASMIMSATWANIFQAVLFGLYHGNIVQGIYAFVLGMFLGFIYNKYQSIFASILLHMAINISGILLGFIIK